MHLSLKAKRFLPAVLSAALLLSTASAGVGYAENSAGKYEILGGNFTGDRRLTVDGTEYQLYCLEHDKLIPNYASDSQGSGSSSATVYQSGDLNFLTDDVKRLVMIAMYAGYPTNGYNLYDNQTVATIDKDTFNKYLIIPESFRNDPYIKATLGENVTYSYQDYVDNNRDHYKRLHQFISDVGTNWKFSKLKSTLSKEEVESSNFYQAAFQMVSADGREPDPQPEDPVKYWNQQIKDGGGADYIAFQATQNAIWRILKENKVANNEKTVSFDELGEKIYNKVMEISQDYKSVDPDPLEKIKIAAPKSLELTYNAEQKQWETQSFTIMDTAETKGSYNISIDDNKLQLMRLNGDKLESAVTINPGESVRLISKDNILYNATLTVTRTVSKEIPKINVNDLKLFSPVNDDTKQMMAGTTFVSGKLSVSSDKFSKDIEAEIIVKPGKATPSDMPASSSDIKKETPSDIVESPSDVPTTPDEPEKPRHRGGSGGGSGHSGATGIKSVFSTPEASTSEVAPETTPAENEAVPSDPEGAVKGQHRDRLHDGNATDGETAGASRSVQTGDHAHMILYLAVSLIALIGLLGWKRKSEKQG